MGGLVCIRNKDRNLSSNILKLIIKHAQRRTKTREAYKGQDQDLLNAHIWPLVKDDSIHHDSYFCEKNSGSTPFPTKRDDQLRFVGCYRPCKAVDKWKPLICPIACRPKNHTDWEYC